MGGGRLQPESSVALSLGLLCPSRLGGELHLTHDGLRMGALDSGEKCVTCGMGCSPGAFCCLYAQVTGQLLEGSASGRHMWIRPHARLQVCWGLGEMKMARLA